jgi:hypothetical protein
MLAPVKVISLIELSRGTARAAISRPRIIIIELPLI